MLAPATATTSPFVVANRAPRARAPAVRAEPARACAAPGSTARSPSRATLTTCCPRATRSTASSFSLARPRPADGRRRVRIGWSGGPAPSSDPRYRSIASAAGVTPLPATVRPRSVTTTTSPTTSIAWCSVRAWSIRAPTSLTREDPLEQAQAHKLDLICRKLRLAPGERLLDIGCGWGSLVLHAAANYGVARGGDHAVPGAGPACARAGPSSWAWRTASISACGLPRADTTSRSTRSPASACTSTSGAPSSTRYVAPSTGCCVPADGSSTTASPGCTPSRPPATFISRDVFPTASFTR